MANAEIAVVESAINWLRTQTGSPKILIKISRNLGDSIHGMPILKHYRKLYPNAAISFLTSKAYHGVHEYNTDISPGGLFVFQKTMNEQERLALWPIIHGAAGIDIKIIPSIHPFGAVHKQNTWCFPNIADQYFANAGIPDQKPVGGRRYTINITPEDKKWADDFFKSRNLDKNNCIIFEYNSYSHPVVWNAKIWQQLINSMPQFKFIGVAGSTEGAIPGMVEARGISWRQTVALLTNVPQMIGVGSGITMLAAGAEKQPKIYELAVPESISMKGCGYADSVSIKDPTPVSVKKALEA